MTEDFFEDAPCGHLCMWLDGTITRVNRTFEALSGHSRDELVGARRFQDLLPPGGRIYYETHLSPLLHMQGSVRAIAVEIECADGSRMPALVNAVLRRDEDGEPRSVWTSIFGAADRREYEDELLRASRREHEIGHRLQRSMLAGTLQATDECEIDAVYRPAVRDMEVGGDWYDAFWLDEGETIGLVVGDVVGHGVDAAATMGQLRSAVRALASTGVGPCALLDRLNEYSARYGVGKMCTLVYAELGLSTGRLRFACAGHPPPLLAVPGQEPRFAWGGRSTPLDALAGSAGCDEDTELLPPGSTVVLYTDGLIERRSQPLDDGMERLRDAVGSNGSGSVSTLLEQLIRVVPDADHGDDICALVARLAPEALA